MWDCQCMTKNERAKIEAIIRAIDAMQTIPDIVGLVYRSVPDASEAKIDMVIESVYDGIEYP